MKVTVFCDVMLCVMVNSCLLPLIFGVEGQVAWEIGVQVCRIGNRNWGSGHANGQ